LLREGYIIKVEKGKYFVVGFEKERIITNPLFIANNLVIPSYVSYWTVAYYYGWTEQVPFTIVSATTKKKKSVKFGKYTFRFVKLKGQKFFGYTKLRINDFDVLVADREKALIDLFDRQEYSGGIVETMKMLYNAKNEINIERLESYAIKMESGAICSRLGYLLEKLGIKSTKLLKHISHSFVRLDLRKRKGRNWNKRWMVNINVSDDELFSWKKA